MLAFRSLRSIRYLTTKELKYSEYGDPAKVVQLTTTELPDSPGNNEIHVRWLAAPINPADLNMIQGIYPVKPTMPAVGGNEGFGRVEQIGSGVKSIKVGNHVLPARAGLGTWRSHGFHNEHDLFPIDNTLSLETSACLQVNPPTAYRMLKDFVNLKPGDTVIQNGANSAVGRAVIQICRARGLKSVNIVRKRDDMAALVEELTALGADLVITEDQLLKEYRGKIKNVPLALNCVGGRSALLLSGTLGQRGVMVTYGGMSKQPLQIATGPLIFKDIRLAGFWMSRWYDEEQNMLERHVMYKELIGWINEGKLSAPRMEKRSLTEYGKALESASQASEKQLFVME